MQFPKRLNIPPVAREGLYYSMANASDGKRTKNYRRVIAASVTDEGNEVRQVEAIHGQTIYSLDQADVIASITACTVDEG